MRDLAIGVFDSGVGGVSVLRALVEKLPGERFLYYGDNKNTPYGTRAEEEIRALSLEAAAFLYDKGIKALVVACNTATSAAIVALRERYASIPVVGIEPALKPASRYYAEGDVLVLATPATLRQSKFQHLYELYGQHAQVLPCPGLMEFVERDELQSEALDAYLRERFASLRSRRIAAAVLGCTHYSFLRRAIERALPGVPLLDGNEGTARRLAYLLAERNAMREDGKGEVRFFTSGEEAVYLPLMQRLFTAPL